MKNKQSGLSLLEILVVITIFSILGVVVTRSVLLTIQGSKKTESLVKVRENVDFAMTVIERQIRNADSITACPLSDPDIFSYSDSTGKTTTFSCVNIAGADGYIASGSGRLTNDTIKLTACSFSCTPGTSNNPSSVSVIVTAEDKSTVTGATSSFSTTNTIYLRNY